MLHNLTTFHLCIILLDIEDSPESTLDPESKIFVRGGRLKRSNMQSQSNDSVQVNRIKGRIVRTDDESSTAGGSVAVRDLLQFLCAC